MQLHDLITQEGELTPEGEKVLSIINQLTKPKPVRYYNVEFKHRIVRIIKQTRDLLVVRYNKKTYNIGKVSAANYLILQITSRNLTQTLSDLIGGEVHYNSGTFNTIILNNSNTYVKFAI